MDYLKKFLRTALLLVGAMLVLFFFLVLVLQTRYGYLHAHEKQSNLPQLNAYAKCKLVGIEDNFNVSNKKYMRYCVYRCDDRSMEFLVKPNNRGCKDNRTLYKTAI